MIFDVFSSLLCWLRCGFALAVTALGVFGGNNDAEAPVASAPADNDDV